MKNKFGIAEHQIQQLKNENQARQQTLAAQISLYATAKKEIDKINTEKDKHKDMYNMCNKYKKEEAAIHFDYLAPNYEGMYLRMGWLDPKYVADYVGKFAAKNNWDHNVKIMDLACGTGLIGQYLSD